MRRVCVFCGSRVGNRPEYAEQARRLGAALVRRGWGLVYGGGNIGLMGIIADVVLQAGGEVIGVIPRALEQKELAHRGLTALHVVDTMHERKTVMSDLADAFVALPGAFGTADELFEILTWSQLGLHRKPIGLLDVAGFFQPLLSWLDRAAGEGFLKPKHRQLLLASKDVEELCDLLCRERPDVTPKWIAEGDR